MDKFELGQIVETRGVHELRQDSAYFDIFVQLSLQRYRNGDWGDLCPEDIENNDYAVRNGERIHAAYIFDAVGIRNYVDSVCDGTQWKPMTQDEKHERCKIWIITEWDRSTTTILFPDEY